MPYLPADTENPDPKMLQLCNIELNGRSSGDFVYMLSHDGRRTDPTGEDREDRRSLDPPLPQCCKQHSGRFRCVDALELVRLLTYIMDERNVGTIESCRTRVHPLRKDIETKMQAMICLNDSRRRAGYLFH